MEGKDIKIGILFNELNINNYKNIENNKKYCLGEIPKFMVNKKKLLEALIKKFGDDGKYIIERIYGNNDDVIDPMKIFELIKK